MAKTLLPACFLAGPTAGVAWERQLNILLAPAGVGENGEELGQSTVWWFSQTELC